MKDIRKSICGRLYQVYNLIKYKDSLAVFWYSGINFGDALNPYFISKITGKKCQLVVNPEDTEILHYIVIGSSVDRATNKSIIWGAGYISEDRKFKSKPYKVCAVRGPKTRDRLIEEGVDCPEIYGDPALLLPRIYKPRIKKRYKLGIIPHYIDKKNPLLKKFQENEDVKIIDITKCNPYKVVNDILECDNIASSSLHGIIIADAYQIPSRWIEFSDKVIGNGFKFYDYFLSVHKEPTPPLRMTENVTFNHILQQCKYNKIDIDLEALIKACPFNTNIF